MAVSSVTSSGGSLLIVDNTATLNIQKEDVISLNTVGSICHLKYKNGIIFVPTSVISQADIQLLLNDEGTGADVTITGDNVGIATSLNQYTDNILLEMIYEELVQINRTLKKIYS